VKRTNANQGMGLNRFRWGSSNDVVYLALLRTSGGDHPVFFLYDPDGLDQLSTGTADYAELQNYRLMKDGIYTVAVLDNGLDESFDYNLSLIKNPGPNASDAGDGPYLMEPYETKQAQITPGDLDAFAFHAIAGDTLTIRLQKTSGPGLHPALQLHAPDGTVLAADSLDTSASVRVSCVSQTGHYLITVFDNGLDEAFGYSLLVEKTPVVPSSSGTTQYLAIYQCAGEVTVRWQTNAAGFLLERAMALPAINWFPVNETPQLIAAHFYFSESLSSDSARFYRLRCTNCVSSAAPR